MWLQALRIQSWNRSITWFVAARRGDRHTLSHGGDQSFQYHPQIIDMLFYVPLLDHYSLLSQARQLYSLTSALINSVSATSICD